LFKTYILTTRYICHAVLQRDGHPRATEALLKTWVGPKATVGMLWKYLLKLRRNDILNRCQQTIGISQVFLTKIIPIFSFFFFCFSFFNNSSSSSSTIVLLLQHFFFVFFFSFAVCSLASSKDELCCPSEVLHITM